MPSTTELEGLIAAARRDPILGVEWLMGCENARLHDDFQKHLAAHDDCYAELPRGHGKTTQTIGRVAWEIGRDPTLRVKYLQQSNKEASKSISLIRATMESERFARLFPWIVPDKDDWSGQSLSVRDTRRDTPPLQRDSNVEASGIFGRAGGRFDLLVPDDVCDLRNSVQQPALRQQVKEAYWNTWYPMADRSRPRPPRIWKVATPYHVSDINAEWRASHEANGTCLRRPVIDFKSPWPDVFTRDEMQRIRAKMGPIAYSRAYELVPITSDMLVFKPEWLLGAMYQDGIPAAAKATGSYIASIDFAYSDKTTTKKAGDPDWSVMIVAWRSALGHLYVVEMIRQQTTFPEFKRAAHASLRRWECAMATAEANGPQKGIVQEFREEAPCAVVPLERVVDKQVRASERQAFVEQGRFHLPAAADGATVRPDVETLYDELVSFPAGDHDDTVDAAIDLMGQANNWSAVEPEGTREKTRLGWDDGHDRGQVEDRERSRIRQSSLWRLYGAPRAR